MVTETSQQVLSFKTESCWVLGFVFNFTISGEVKIFVKEEFKNRRKEGRNNGEKVRRKEENKNMVMLFLSVVFFC